MQRCTRHRSPLPTCPLAADRVFARAPLWRRWKPSWCRRACCKSTTSSCRRSACAFTWAPHWSPPARYACACSCARAPHELARHLLCRPGHDCRVHAVAAQPEPGQCCHRGQFLGLQLCAAGLDVFCAGCRLPAAPAAGGSAGHHLGCAPQHTHLAAQPRPPGRFPLPCLALAVGRQLCLAQPVAGIFAARRIAVADIGAAAAGPGTARTRSAGQVGCTWHPALAGGLCVRSRRELAAATLQSQAC